MFKNGLNCFAILLGGYSRPLSEGIRRNCWSPANLSEEDGGKSLTGIDRECRFKV
jgi:hypothetical protein